MNKYFFSLQVYCLLFPFLLLSLPIKGQINLASPNSASINLNTREYCLVGRESCDNAISLHSVPPYPDLALIAAQLSPEIPAPLDTFTVTILLQNRGNSAARSFVVGAKFEPSEEISSKVVAETLEPGKSITVELNGRVNGTISTTVAIVLDLNNDIDEGPFGERNNSIPFTYKVDYPILEMGVIEVSFSDEDFVIGTTNIGTLDKTGWIPTENVSIATLRNVSFDQVTYDALKSEEVQYIDRIKRDELTVGTVIAVMTSNDKKYVLHILSTEVDRLQIEYHIYLVPSQ